MSDHILILSERFPPDIGGVARSASRTAKQINRLGYQCDVFTWTRTLPPGQLESKPVTVDGASMTVHRLGLFGNFDFSMQHTMNCVEWLHAEYPFDTVWGHYLYPSGFMAVMLSGMLDLPVTVSARGNDIDRLVFPPGDFARLEWTLRRADVVTAVSHDLARKIRHITPGTDPVVIHNTVDPQLFRPGDADADLRDGLGIYPQEVVLGFCGELRHKKGLPFLMQGLQALRSQQPACLLIIGDIRTREAASIRDLVDEETFKRILVTGPLNSPHEVVDYLRLCDIVLSPSVWDGLPNALLEAMACERVVLASDAGGIPEIVDHGKNGFLIPKAQLHRLSEAITEVLSLSPAERTRIGREAREKMLDAFHPDREAKELESVLRGLRSSASS